MAPSGLCVGQLSAGQGGTGRANLDSCPGIAVEEEDVGGSASEARSKTQASSKLLPAFILGQRLESLGSMRPRDAQSTGIPLVMAIDSLRARIAPLQRSSRAAFPLLAGRSGTAADWYAVRGLFLSCTGGVGESAAQSVPTQEAHSPYRDCGLWLSQG